MNAFLIDLENKPGELARVAEAIAGKGANIENITGATCGSTGRAALMTSDDAATRSALAEAKCTFTEVEGVDAVMPHEPGTLARTCRRLADAGINIEALLPLGVEGSNAKVGFVTDQPAKARDILSHAGSATR